MFPRLWQGILSHWGGVGETVEGCSGFHNLAGVPAELRSFFQQSYPRNHTFTLKEDRLVPTRRLAERVAQLAPQYPTPLTSLVDLSCSKGYFVFDAASRPGCRRALGVDIDLSCVQACRELAKNLVLPESVAFQQITLPELANRIDDFGGPFQTALLDNTYQYLRLGSEFAPGVGGSHRELFEWLGRICSGRLVFHNRLSFDDLQKSVQVRTPAHEAKDYSPKSILEAADEFFIVQSSTGDPLRPLLVLENRAAIPGRAAA